MDFKKISFYITHILYPFLIYGCFFATSGFIYSQYLRLLREYELVAARDVQLLLPIPILLAFFSSARTLIAYDLLCYRKESPRLLQANKGCLLLL